MKQNKKKKKEEELEANKIELYKTVYSYAVLALIIIFFNFSSVL